MNLRHLTARTAIAGVTTALAAGALVGVSTTAANAVDNTTAYSCSLGPTAVGTFSLKISTPVIPPTATAGQSFPAGLLALDAQVTIPATLTPALAGAGVNGGKVNDYAGSVGTTKLAAPLTFGAPAVQGDGSAIMTGAGAVGKFTLPKAASYKVQLPKTFNFVPTKDGAAKPFTVTCTTAAPGTLGNITITKGMATIKPKATKVKKGYSLKVAVTRTDSTIKPTGKVTAKFGKKKVTKPLKKGKAVLALPKAAKGKKVVISYTGDGFVKPGKATIKKLK